MDPNVNGIAEQLGKTIAGVVQSSMNATHDAQQSIYLGTIAIGIVSSIIAGIIGRRYQAPAITAANLRDGMNQEAMLYATLLAAACNSAEPTKKDQQDGAIVNTHFGPEGFVQAREWFEKLTNKKVDDYLNKDLVAAIDATMKEAAEPLDALLASRGKTLN